MYVCMYVFLHVPRYLCINVFVCMFAYACMHVCMPVRMHRLMYVVFLCVCAWAIVPQVDRYFGKAVL